MNLAKSALWVTVSEVIFNLSGFIIHSVLGRFLGPAEYGKYGIVVTLTTMVIILIGNGIPTAMSKYLSEYFEKDVRMVRLIKKKAVRLQILIIGCVSIIFFFTAPIIAKLLGDPELTSLFRLSTLIIPAFAAASFYFSYFTGLHRFNTQALLKTLRSIFRIVFVIMLAYMFGVPGSILGYIIAPTFVFLMAFIIDKFKVEKDLKYQECQLLSQGIEKSKYDFGAKMLLNYAWQIVVFFLAYELLISIDLYLVKAITLNDQLTGIYNAALTVGRIPYYIFYAMTIFLLPMVSKSSSENNFKETIKILSQSLRIMLILLAPMIVLMSIYAKPIIVDFYGSKYASGALPMSVIEFGVGFLTIFYVMSFALNGAGKTKVVMWISITGFLINAALNFWLIRYYSILGSAIATTIASLVVMLMIIYYLVKKYGALVRLWTLLKVGIAVIGMYVVSFFFSKGEITFIFWSLFLLAFYLFVLYILKEIKKEDIKILKNIIARKKNNEVEAGLSGNEPSA